MQFIVLNFKKDEVAKKKHFSSETVAKKEHTALETASKVEGSGLEIGDKASAIERKEWKTQVDFLELMNKEYGG